MSLIIHVFAIIAATGYLSLLFFAGVAILVFLYAGKEDEWNALNESDPEQDFMFQDSQSGIRLY